MARLWLALILWLAMIQTTGVRAASPYMVSPRAPTASKPSLKLHNVFLNPPASPLAMLPPPPGSRPGAKTPIGYQAPRLR